MFNVHVSIPNSKSTRKIHLFDTHVSYSKRICIENMIGERVEYEYVLHRFTSPSHKENVIYIGV